MGLIIFGIIAIIFGVILLFINILDENENNLGFPGFILITLGILSIFSNNYHIQNNNKSKLEYKINLPEEIYQSRQGDTLYITKRTKDSIYLGFKPIKE